MLALGLCVGLAAPGAQAATKTWNSTSSNAWLTAGNWSTSGVPGTSDVALFNGAAQPPGGIAAIQLKNGASTTLQAITLTLGSGSLTIGNNETSGNSNIDSLVLTGTTINSVASTVLANLTTSASTLTIQNTVSGGTKSLNLSLTSSANVMQASANNSIAISSVITGASGSLTFQGGGVLELSGANTFTGALVIADGALRVATINNASAAGVLGNSANAVTLGSGGKTGTLRYTGVSATSNKAFNLATGGGGVFEVTSGATNLTLNGNVGGSGTLEKTGAGTLTLNGSLSYTGATTVSGGSLFLNGASGSDLTVKNGGLLGGTATVNGKLLVENGGTVSPGNSTEILHTGDFETTLGAHIAIELGGTTAGFNTDGTDGYDQIAADGVITLAAGTIIDVTLLGGYSPALNTTYNILTATGGFDGTVIGSLTFNTPTLPDDHAFMAQFVTLDQDTTALQLTVIPEPETWAMLAGSLGILAFWKTMRRQRGRAVA